MPLQRQAPLEIVLGQGPDEKTSPLLRAPGVLRVAENVSFDKAGAAHKRPGYRRLLLSAETHGGSGESLFVRVATYQNELVVYGARWIYGAHSDEELLDGPAGLTRRGPTMVGNWRGYDIHASSLSEEN